MHVLFHIHTRFLSYTHTYVYTQAPTSRSVNPADPRVGTVSRSTLMLRRRADTPGGYTERETTYCDMSVKVDCSKWSWIETMLGTVTINMYQQNTKKHFYFQAIILSYPKKVYTDLKIIKEQRTGY